MSTLPLKPVVDVYYNLGPLAAVRQGFNLGAIVGSSTTISQKTRGVVFNSVDEMIEYGFANESPELLAAQVYFSATSGPDQLYVGRWVKESTYNKVYYQGPIGNGNKVTIGETTYTIGDGTSETTTVANLVTAAQNAGATTASYQNEVLYILFTAAQAGSAGTLTTFEVLQADGPSVNDLVKENGEDQESQLEAIQEMRQANSNWYSIALTEEADKAVIQSIASYIETTENSIPSTYFAHTSSLDVINNQGGNIFSTLKGLKLQRTIGTASIQPYTHIGIMGYAMGQTRDTAGSSYTLALKEVPGTLVDDFTSTQVTNIETNNGNVYINRGAQYDMYEPGKVFYGAWFDEIIQLDKLVNRIQLNVMDVLYKNPKVPQTNDGLALILSTIEQACRESVKIGFIAPGQWNNSPILNLATGDYLPTGYLIQSESFEDQSQADRDARKAPNIYVAIKLAGAIQSVVIQIDVNR